MEFLRYFDTSILNLRGERRLEQNFLDLQLGIDVSRPPPQVCRGDAGLLDDLRQTFMVQASLQAYNN